MDGFSDYLLSPHVWGREDPVFKFILDYAAVMECKPNTHRRSFVAAMVLARDPGFVAWVKDILSIGDPDDEGCVHCVHCRDPLRPEEVFGILCRHCQEPPFPPKEPVMNLIPERKKPRRKRARLFHKDEVIDLTKED